MRIFSPKSFKDFKLGDGKKLDIDWKKVVRIGLITGAAGVIFVAAVFAWFWKDLPDPGKINNRFIAESTKIYDRSGEHLLYDVHGEEKRTQIPFEEMPDVLKYATISLEDQDFYNHHGIKLTSIARSVLKDIINLSKAQGGSTITQQFVKNSLLSNEKDLVRKVKEVILSLELETKFSKDEILAMYLNEIPYGSNAYGVEAAAQTFFGKHAKELTLDESALLASLPQAPTRYSPYGSYPELLKARQEYALKQMASLGYITQEQADEAKKVDVLSKISTNKENINAPHFVMYVKEYLVAKYGEKEVAEGGMKVYTTLDWDKQMAAEQAVREGVEKNVKYKASNAALVAMDPKTGQILAMVGSKNYFDKSIDGQVNVAIRQRQPGSSFKPFVYLTAFQKGFTPETNIWDVDINFSTDDGKIYNPKNYDGKNRGLLQMKNALAMSLNVPAVETLYLAGVQNSINTAHQLGISTLRDPDKYGLSLVLGGGEVTLLDHTNAYATLATGGIHHDQSSILKVEDSKGNIVEKYQGDPGERVVEEKYVAMLDYILTTNELRAPVFGSNSPLKFDGRVAAKTGTTNEWRDAWTMGYSTSIAVGVWAGNNNNSPMAEGADGVYTAAPIWRAFMDSALKNMPMEDFPKYDQKDTGKDVLDGKLEMKKEVKVCEIPGTKEDYCLASSACPDSLVEKKDFSDTHSILYYVDKDSPQGDAPEHPESDPQFKGWEKAIREWLKEQKGMGADPAPTEECSDKDFKNALPSIRITSPGKGDTITSPSFTISASADAGYGVKDIAIAVNGQVIAKGSDSDISATYDVPADRKISTLEITAAVTDENKNNASESISVNTNIL